MDNHLLSLPPLGLDPTLPSLDKFEERHRKQGDLVVEGFQNLLRKYDPEIARQRTGHISIGEILTIGQINSREGLMEWLHSGLLPLLKQQLTTVKLCLIPSALQTEPEAKLTLMLEVQSAIDQNLARMESAFAVICPRPLSASDRVDDHQLKQFKYYRLDDLAQKFYEVQNHTAGVFEKAYVHIQRMKLSTEQVACPPGGLDYIEYVEEEALGYIDSTIACLNGPEFDVAEDQWRYHVKSMDDILEDTISLIDPLLDWRTMLSFKDYELRPRRKLVRKPVIELMKSTSPIIKLSRLFFKKIIKHHKNRSKHLPWFTEMNSKQLECFCASAFDVSRNLVKLVQDLCKADGNRRFGEIRSHDIIQSVEALAGRLEATIHLVVIYLIPLTPESDDLADRNYFRSWFMTWNTLFILALHNFKYLARSSFDHVNLP
ncbi:hypothetical protein MJO28_011136 [Puccinia striiformis f. sp. tritici]|uniref:Uncharacterized protein n=3 Tax=Puccinia striiformis TaxID=27350 RepID=A0A0L0V2V7_9BASI|nr:hypothetical protein Pst134EA_020847 [Puccinia striiformis f. sp. tritici]KAI9620214.1 hypothetical protein H4Q26_013782 [Puccinia striiformis f. sp. tritici PST-130]KNE93617.1 hypothetical protein PSTG_12993 [Puccinia striiformis f. sp. tritici PST-78]POW07130.1 hypothetical protein PSTT_08506 [Puccinia striiformis]KAH9447627.1 hypothetical protein Pst134EB_021637 [Puccinia striiformis f. sp. tritici]KAH9456940.1 hypothetical protein Pst134EA_020847 [Puccinia striiformis f. sp. tritici]